MSGWYLLFSSACIILTWVLLAYAAGFGRRG